MCDEGNLNVLLSNIISENNFAHCRICLKPILDDKYLRFEDNLSLDIEKGIFSSLSEVVIDLTEDVTMLDIIPGVDAVCNTCAEEALQATLFLQRCKQSTNTLTNMIDTLSEKLNNCIEAASYQNVYIHVSESSAQVTIHRKPKKKAKKLVHLKCLECMIELKTVTELEVHNKDFHNLYTCILCLDRFQSKSDLKTHITNKLKCEECHEYKCNKRLMEDHILKHHSSCVCNECGKTLQDVQQLNEHERKHHQKQACPKCGKSYSTLNFYLKHVELCMNNMLDPHPMRSRSAKEFICKECGKAYCSNGSLRVHERFAHYGEKGHKCKDCGKVFTAPSSLKLHLVTHTRERNFKCDICQKRFVSKEALLYHTRRHTGEKPYECDLCSERFVNASARAEHIKFKHIGPTIECDICLRKFVTAHFMNVHRSRHFDKSSKLYAGRASVPANLPTEENIRNLHALANS